MDRGYISPREAYTNPDYALEDIQHRNQYEPQDFKQAHGYAHGVPTQVYDQSLDEVEDSPYGHPDDSAFKRIGLHALRVMFTIIFVGLLLGIPLLVTMDSAYETTSTIDSVQNKNFVFWFFVWLESTFAMAAAAHMFALLFPYIFYGFAKWINPAHRRYWRVFRPLKGPFVCLVTIASGWLFFFATIYANDSLNYAYFANQQSAAQAGAGVLGTDGTTSADSSLGTDRTFFPAVCLVINNILMNAIFWAVAYLFEKIVIIYISVHYHYRSDHHRIEQSKRLVNALATLYDASLSRDHLYCDMFQDQDIIIRDAVASAKRNKRATLKFFQKIGGASGKVLSAFGTMLGSDAKSHWLKAGSTYAVVEHALEKPASAKALAQRIFFSMVPQGQDALNSDLIANTFSIDHKEEAESCMKALDENDNGDIRITELEPMLVEAGKTRLNIYQNMQEIDHAINTFDWILLIWIAIFMLFIILLGYIDFLKQLKDIFGFVGLGLGVAIKSVVSDFILGCVFIFFKHPYDVGDRIDLYTMGEGSATGVTVKRISLLYCIFERTDTGATVQFPNSRLWIKRIENLTRSGQGMEKFTMNLSIETSFKDLEYLRDEMKSFLSADENTRDYKPNVALRVKSIHDLDKMEVAMVITHKSNWSNDALKSARSSRIYCRLLEVARMVPLHKPGGGKSQLGEEAKPNYMVVVSDEEAAVKRHEEELKTLKKRHDFEIVNEEGLDAEAKKAKDAVLKQAEAEAYKGISSIPSTLPGRGAERPPPRASFQSTPALQREDVSAVQYYDTPLQEPRQRTESRSFSSMRPLFENSYSYEGAQTATPGVPLQTYDGRRGNGLQDSNRGNRI